jgi:hypothetical protein
MLTVELAERLLALAQAAADEPLEEAAERREVLFAAAARLHTCAGCAYCEHAARADRVDQGP